MRAGVMTQLAALPPWQCLNGHSNRVLGANLSLVFKTESSSSPSCLFLKWLRLLVQRLLLQDLRLFITGKRIKSLNSLKNFLSLALFSLHWTAFQLVTAFSGLNTVLVVHQLVLNDYKLANVQVFNNTSITNYRSAHQIPYPKDLLPTFLGAELLQLHSYWSLWYNKGGFPGMHNAITSSTVQIHRNMLGDIKTRNGWLHVLPRHILVQSKNEGTWHPTEMGIQVFCFHINLHI